MTVKKQELWQRRTLVIRKTEKNDYSEIAEFKVTTLYRGKMANDAALTVNAFIRRMIKKEKK